MDRILYSPKEGTTGFWGLRGYPTKPDSDDFSTYQSGGILFENAMEHYEKCLKYCKSNKLEIVNPEVTGVTEDSMNQCLHIKGKYLKPGDIFSIPEGWEFKEEERFIPKPYKKLFSQTPVEAKIESVKVLRLVKTDMKDLLTFECKDENCPHCNFEREFAQPEPEESQKWANEKLIDIQRRLNLNANDAGQETFDWFEWGIISDIFNNFIQRNKQ